VPDQDFYFALDMAGAPDATSTPPEMLDDLVARVLERAGCAGDAAAALTEAIHTALAQASRADSPSRLQFRARDGRLDIVVSSRAGAIWQTTCDVAGHRR
jgi:hypothetical protein